MLLARHGGRHRRRAARVGCRRERGDEQRRRRRPAPHAEEPPSGDGTAWRLDLAYEGTAYRGWARQPGQRTVEGLLEEALATVLREPVRLSVAGRTDAGVHALGAGGVVRLRAPDLAPERLRLSLNALLPPDVAVTARVAGAAGLRRARGARRAPTATPVGARR